MARETRLTYPGRMGSVFGKRMQVPRGTLIVREGDHDSAAYLILEGTAAVTTMASGKAVLLATLGEGDFFGEMSLVLDQPRSASVRALSDCRVSMVERDDFNAALRSDPEQIFPLLRVLFERLRIMNAKYALAMRQLGDVAAGRAVTPSTRGPVAGDGGATPPRARRHRTPLPEDLGHPRSLHAFAGTLRVSGVSEPARAALGGHNTLIERLPFRFGRQATLAPTGADVFVLNDLDIVDAAPYHVSRNHCAVDVSDDGRPVVQDRGSRLGTIVNGRSLGAHHDRLEEPLRRGDNTVVLGAPGSPYVFSVRYDPLP